MPNQRIAVCLYAAGAVALIACGGGGGGGVATAVADAAAAGQTPVAAPAASAPASAPAAAPAPGPAPVAVPPAAPAPAPASPPGGLYVGYYAEDPATNPEDPTLGGFSLVLPDGNGPHYGAMFFTYVGCQTSNVGAVVGTKTDLQLSGKWSGDVDGQQQAGSYSGAFDTTAQSYAGTYVNGGGKQFRDLSPCIQYTIAPNGTWEMFPIDRSVPSGFSVSVSGRTIGWDETADAALTLVYLLDPSVARSGGNPVLWQTIVGTDNRVDVPASVNLLPGREYAAVVGVADTLVRRSAFGSVRFTAP